MSEEHGSNTEEFKAFVQRGATEVAPRSRTPLIAGAVVLAIVILAVVVYLAT